MSIGPLGVPGSAAHDLNIQSRHEASAQQAEKAAGVGETEQDHEATDRDADGRRLWERGGKTTGEKSSDESDQAKSAQSRDASGERGNQLDISG